MKEKKLYLTKRILVNVGGKAIRNASNKTMDQMGYTVQADNGNIIKIYKDGRQEILEKLPVIKRPSKIVLQ